MSRASRLALSLALSFPFALALAVGCEPSVDLPGKEPPPRAHSTTATTSAASVPPASRSAAPPPQLGEPVGSASAGAGGSDEIAGTWAGRYDAKKGSVSLPPKVKDKGLASDDGTAAVGPGSIEIAILPSGDVRGKMSGALGGGEISGKLDGGMIRTVVRPEDPYANRAMTGIFVGERKGDVLVCELHVAGPDGTMIRESSVELKRKK